jgi:hypothetical protein
MMVSQIAGALDERLQFGYRPVEEQVCLVVLSYTLVPHHSFLKRQTWSDIMQANVHVIYGWQTSPNN